MKDRASYNAGRASQKVQDIAHDAKEKLSKFVNILFIKCMIFENLIKPLFLKTK